MKSPGSQALEDAWWLKTAWALASGGRAQNLYRIFDEELGRIDHQGWPTRDAAAPEEDDG